MAKKKHKGLFGLGSVEYDVVELGKGVAGAVAFDLFMNRMTGHHGGGRGGGHHLKVDHDQYPLAGAMEGIEDMTGMKGHPVAMAVTGLLVMQTSWREFGKGMATIGAYNAVTSHRFIRELGGGMHGIEGHDVLAAIESGIQEKMEALKKDDSPSNPLSDTMYENTSASRVAAEM